MPDAIRVLRRPRRGRSGEALVHFGLEPREAPCALVSGLQPYVSSGRFYQGPGTYVPLTITIGNFIQEMMLTGNVSGFTSSRDRGLFLQQSHVKKVLQSPRSVALPISAPWHRRAQLKNQLC